MEKVTLITGASGDIGTAIACQLAEKGHQLVLHYHKNQQAMENLIQILPDEYICKVIQANLSTDRGIGQLIKELPSSVDSFIHTSGATYYGLFQYMTDEDMDDMLHIHVKAPWKITKQLLPAMIQKKSGNIILITSIWGEIGASCEVAYSSVKGAQQSFIRALAKEVGPSGISVNGVSPGFIDTKMNDIFSSEEKQAFISEIPLGRAGTPRDIANTVDFLLQHQTSYIQGEIIRVNGALT